MSGWRKSELGSLQEEEIFEISQADLEDFVVVSEDLIGVLVFDGGERVCEFGEGMDLADRLLEDWVVWVCDEGRALLTKDDVVSVQKLWKVKELLFTEWHLKHFHSIDEFARVLKSEDGMFRQDL